MLTKQNCYFLLILNLFLGSYFYWEECCNTDENSSQSPTEIKINAANFFKNHFQVYDATGESFSLIGKDNFSFEKSSSSFITPLSADLVKSIKELKSYIIENDNKKLHIIGVYGHKEQSSLEDTSLGISRALSVKNYLKEIGISNQKMDVSEAMEDSLEIIDELYKDAVRFEIVGDVFNKNPGHGLFSISNIRNSLKNERR